MLENIPGRHGDDARVDALLRQFLVSIDRKRHFASRRDDDGIGRRRVAAGKHIGALRNAGSGGIFAAIEGRQGLARYDECCRFMAQLHDIAVGLDHFIGIGRAG